VSLKYNECKFAELTEEDYSKHWQCSLFKDYCKYENPERDCLEFEMEDFLSTRIPANVNENDFENL